MAKTVNLDERISITPKGVITLLEQQIGLACAKCINTYSGVPMLVVKGSTLQCRLRTCYRKRVKALIKELRDAEKALARR